MRTREGGWWLAKCGRPLGKKFLSNIFVKFTQIIWQYVYRKFSFCLYSIENVWNVM